MSYFESSYTDNYRVVISLCRPWHQWYSSGGTLENCYGSCWP